MKLIGSMPEQQFRKQMEKSHDAIFEDKRLLAALRETFPEMKTAYALSGHPDEDIYFFTILVDCTDIARVELDLSNNAVEPIVQVKSLSVFKKGLGKMHQI